MEQEEMDKRLWDYIDGLSNDAEGRQMQTLLEKDSSWKARYETLLSLHEQLLQPTMDHPSIRFTQNIMDEIEQLPTPFSVQGYINKRLIKGVAAVFVLMLSSLLIYSFFKVNWHGTGSNYVSNYVGSLFTGFKISTTAIQAIIGINILFLLVLAERLSSTFMKDKFRRKAH